MITLTERAARQVERLLKEKASGEQLLRVFVETGGCSGLQYGMSFDLPKPDDNVIESGGVKVLLDPASGIYLNGSTVDFDDGLHGKGFEIRNPNAQSSCGCGKSFN